MEEFKKPDRCEVGEVEDTDIGVEGKMKEPSHILKRRVIEGARSSEEADRTHAAGGVGVFLEHIKDHRRDIVVAVSRYRKGYAREEMRTCASSPGVADESTVLEREEIVRQEVDNEIDNVNVEDWKNGACRMSGGCEAHDVQESRKEIRVPVARSMRLLYDGHSRR